jgi:hypothetical protein
VKGLVQTAPADLGPSVFICGFNPLIQLNDFRFLPMSCVWQLLEMKPSRETI